MFDLPFDYFIPSHFYPFYLHNKKPRSVIKNHLQHIFVASSLDWKSCKMIASIKEVSKRRRYANVCRDVVLHDLSVTYSDKNEDLCVSYPVFSFRHSNHWKLSWTLAFRYQLSYLKKGETWYSCKSFELTIRSSDTF